MCTFGHVHGVGGAQQVPDVQVVSLLFTEPVVAGEVEAEMRSDHIRHHHSVQEPAGVHASVVVLNPAATTFTSVHTCISGLFTRVLEQKSDMSILCHFTPMS